MTENTSPSTPRGAPRFTKIFEKGLSGGVHWFIAATAMPSLVTLVLSPLIIRKVGLDEYAVLALAIYFFNLVGSYTDFATHTHLLVVFSRNDDNRKVAFGNAVMIRVLLLAIAFAGLMIIARLYPRDDGMYALLGAYMVGIPLSNSIIDWFLIAKKRYRHLFFVRLWSMLVLVAATLLWIAFGPPHAFFVPVIATASASVGCLLILWFAGREAVKQGGAAILAASPAGAFRLSFSLAPMVMTIAFTPYFLAYALPWYTMVVDSSTMVGVFSLTYRLVMGFVALAAPLVAYSISRGPAAATAPSLPRALGLSAVMSAICWLSGAIVLRAYFTVADVELALFPFSLKAFSILMIGIFFICLRVPYVGRCLALGRYWTFGLVHFASCLPTLLLSLLGQRVISGSAVIWLALLPEILVTFAFLVMSRREFRSRRLSF